MKRTCQRCGKTWDAQSSRAKFCSAKCRVSAHRARRGVVGNLPAKAREAAAASVVALPTASVPGDVDGVPPETLHGSVAAELEQLEARHTPEGLALLALARRIDTAEDTGSGMAAVTREFRAQLAAVRTAYARPEADIVDQLAERRATSGA